MTDKKTVEGALKVVGDIQLKVFLKLETYLRAWEADHAAEIAEQARVNGMGAERELALMAKLEAAERRIAELESALAAQGAGEPVGWACKDYADGWIFFTDYQEALKYQSATDCAFMTLYTRRPPAPEQAEAVRKDVLIAELFGALKLMEAAQARIEDLPMFPTSHAIEGARFNLFDARKAAVAAIDAALAAGEQG